MSSPSTPILDLESLKEDIQRQSTLHSWYKKLPLDPCLSFYLVPAIGQQPRNQISLEVRDATGVHWYFHDSPRLIPAVAREIVAKYPIKVNPFFHHEIHVNENGRRRAYGFYIIYSDWSANGRRRLEMQKTIPGIASNRTLEDWLTKRYPEVWSRIADSVETNPYSLDEDRDELEAQIFDAEFSRISSEMVAAAQSIWGEMAAAGIHPKDVKFSE